MNFTLTDEQVNEFIARCVERRNNDDKKHYNYEIISNDDSNIWVELTRKDGYSQSYNIFLEYIVSYNQITGPICKDMQKLFVEYMYELFGEDYLRHVETVKRRQITAAKTELQRDFDRQYRKLDSKLIEFLLMLNAVRDNALKQ